MPDTNAPSEAPSSVSPLLMTTLAAARGQIAPLQACPGSGWSGVFSWLTSLLGSLGGVYYSLRANKDSMGWAIFWFFLGGTFPAVGITVGAFQVYKRYQLDDAPAFGAPSGPAPALSTAPTSPSAFANNPTSG